MCRMTIGNRTYLLKRKIPILSRFKASRFSPEYAILLAEILHKFSNQSLGQEMYQRSRKKEGREKSRTCKGSVVDDSFFQS